MKNKKKTKKLEYAPPIKLCRSIFCKLKVAKNTKVISTKKNTEVITRLCPFIYIFGQIFNFDTILYLYSFLFNYQYNYFVNIILIFNAIKLLISV